MGDGEFQKHTSCISEAQKYEKTVWKGDKKGKGKNQQNQQKPGPNGAAVANEKAAAKEAEKAAPAVKEAEKPLPSADNSQEKGAEPAPPAEKSAKKDKKDRKRKREEGKAAAQASEGAPAAGIEQSKPAAEVTDEPAEGKSKKNKKAKKDNAAAASTQNGHLDPKVALEAALSAALSGENGSIALKDILNKAGQNTDELLAQIKVEKGKKGKFVLSL